MKNIILLILICSFNINAQTPIIDRYGNYVGLGDIENAYYKDVQNLRDQFVGTWTYSNGNELLRVRFRKIDFFYENWGGTPYYEDFLVGEVYYKDAGGVVKINRLNALNQNFTSIYEYSMYSESFIRNNDIPNCLDCPLNTRRLYMFYSEPQVDDAGLKAGWAMRVVNENGVLKLKVQFELTDTAVGLNKYDYQSPSTMKEHYLPYRDYVLVKE